MRPNNLGNGINPQDPNKPESVDASSVAGGDMSSGKKPTWGLNLSHRIAQLAEAYGGVASKPFNTDGEILTRVSVLDENGDRIGVSIYARFATREEMVNTCIALNIPEKDWPESHT